MNPFQNTHSQKFPFYAHRHAQTIFEKKKVKLPRKYHNITPLQDPTFINITSKLKQLKIEPLFIFRALDSRTKTRTSSVREGSGTLYSSSPSFSCNLKALDPRTRIKTSTILFAWSLTKVSFVRSTHQNSLRRLLRQVCHPYTASLPLQNAFREISAKLVVFNAKLQITSARKRGRVQSTRPLADKTRTGFRSLILSSLLSL